MSFTYDWSAQAVANAALGCLVNCQAVFVTNPNGAQFVLSREADGVFRASSGRSGAIEMEVTPTASGRTLRFADGTQYDFDSGGRLLAMRDLNGNQTTFQLNSDFFPVSMTD